MRAFLQATSRYWVRTSGKGIARLYGTGAHKPVLFICHTDVVEARRGDWSLDPFQFTEKDGYFYGRGTEDIKDGDAILVTTFIRLKREGYKPDRDIILALTADEEGGESNGVNWLLQNHARISPRRRTLPAALRARI